MSDLNHSFRMVGVPPPENAIVPVTIGLPGAANSMNPNWIGSPLNPNYVPPIRYVDAFDPSGSQYSVNTGNASVHDLETLNSIFSDPPIAPKIEDPSANLYLGIAGIAILYIVMKGI